MQFKRSLEAIPLAGSFQLVWNRISFSRLTLIYFLFSVSHFIIQLSLQIRAFTINSEAVSLLSRIVNEADIATKSLPILQGDNLRMCSWVPSSLKLDTTSCPVVWSSNPNGTARSAPLSNNAGSLTYDSSSTLSSTVTSLSASPSSSTLVEFVSTSSSASKTSASSTSSIRSTSKSSTPQTITIFIARPTPSPKNDDDDDDEDEDEKDDRKRSLIGRDLKIVPSNTDGPVTVTLFGLDGNKEAFLSNSCLNTLNWPLSILSNTKREDIVFIAFQFWVLGMSIVALLNESIPHIIASLLTHVLATGWATFQIVHTANFRTDFRRVITNGACKDIPLLPNYWTARSAAEIPSLVLNVVALFVSVFLTWKLIKLFGWQTFKRVGASLTINRVYKVVLTLSITIQLSLFFMVVTVSLWIDQLMNSVIGDLVDFLKLYKITSFITLALLVPWLMTGWFGVRRELRMPMFVFLLLSILYLGGWGVMFFSTTFRWTFITWRFFSIMASASVFLTCMCIILGVICRFNFGKGLSRYLNTHEEAPESGFPATYGGNDIEKVAFPSSEKPLPTYMTYDRAFTPSMYSGSTMGPRFSNPSAVPFETAPGLPYPAPAVTHNSSDLQVHRSDSGASKSTYTTQGSKSYHSRSDSGHSHGSPSKQRWIIE